MIINLIGITTNNMAKNRHTIITELFTAFAELEDFQYDYAELKAFFDECVLKKSLKNLSKPREPVGKDGSGATKSRGKSGYQHYLAEFNNNIIPDGANKRTFKTEAWKKLTEEERQEWKTQADSLNELDVSIQKSKKTSSHMTSNEKLFKWKEAMKDWDNEDPDTRGPAPIRENYHGSSQTSSADNSGASSPKSTIVFPPKNKESDEDLAKKLANLKRIEAESASESDSDSDSDEDEDADEGDNADEGNNAKIYDMMYDEDNKSTERMVWLRTHITQTGGKTNLSADFKAWIMYNNHDQYGPDKDNTISSAVLNDLKAQHDYIALKMDPSSKWYHFLTVNDLIIKS